MPPPEYTCFKHVHVLFLKHSYFLEDCTCFTCTFPDFSKCWIIISILRNAVQGVPLKSYSRCPIFNTRVPPCTFFERGIYISKVDISTRRDSCFSISKTYNFIRGHPSVNISKMHNFTRVLMFLKVSSEKC